MSLDRPASVQPHADPRLLADIGATYARFCIERLSGRFEHVAGLEGHFHLADKKGYSGVGLYTKKAPSDVIAGFDRGEFVRAPACGRCDLATRCFGVRRSYAELHGTDELRPVVL